MNGNRLSPEPERRQFCIPSISAATTFLYGFRNLIVSTFLAISAALAMAMVASCNFGRSLHQPIPVRCNWGVFARKMHSATEFATTVLSKCVTHAGFVKVARTLRGTPF